MMNDAAWIWSAKLAGAIAGSSISIAYMLPKGRREAALRFAIGLATGLTFGGPLGTKIALELGLYGKIGEFESALMGASAASLCAWWALGVIRRFLEHLSSKPAHQNDHKTPKGKTLNVQK